MGSLHNRDVGFNLNLTPTGDPESSAQGRLATSRFDFQPELYGQATHPASTVSRDAAERAPNGQHQPYCAITNCTLMLWAVAATAVEAVDWPALVTRRRGWAAAVGPSLICAKTG